MLLEDALATAREYLKPGSPYGPPTFEQRVALRRIIRAAETLRQGLSDIRDNAEDALAKALED